MLQIGYLVDLPSFARDIDKLAAADAVVADSYLRYALRKGALYFLACLFAVMGLLLLGLALYWLLAASFGATAAIALLGILGCLLAGLIAVIAVLQRPGREFSLALEMRRSAVATFERNVASTSLGAGALLYPAGEAFISSVLLPLIGALIRSLKSSHGDAGEKQDELKLSEIADAPLSSNAPKT